VTLVAREPNARACGDLVGVRVVGLVHRDGLLGGRPAYLRQVERALRPWPDVLHVHGLARMAHWLLPRRVRRGARLVVTAHSADELGPTGSPSGGSTPRRARRHAAQRLAVLRGADAVVAPSRHVAERVAEVSGRRADVVPWGPSDLAPAPRAPHDGFEVLVQARLVRAKGVHVLLEAFAKAFREDAAARLVVAGDGPEGPRLRELARARGVHDRVEFAGYVDGPARRARLARADVVAVPTLDGQETFCLAALDGAAAGAALLVSAGGALPERVDGCGEILPAGDVDAWAAGLARLRADPALVARYGDAARRVAATTTWDGAAAGYERLFAGGT
jgi:glycosyltransferase involved in cell wall biosynthesis